MSVYFISVIPIYSIVPQAESVPVATFSFKPLVESDLDMLFAWFRQPYIEKLWKEPKDFGIFKSKYMKHITTQDIAPFIACIQDTPVAYIQYHYTNAEDRAIVNDFSIPEKSIGIDVFIGNPKYLNKGYGATLLKEFIAFIKDREPNCEAIIIDPATNNDRAIACYKKLASRHWVNIFHRMAPLETALVRS